MANPETKHGLLSRIKRPLLSAITEMEDADKHEEEFLIIIDGAKIGAKVTVVHNSANQKEYGALIYFTDLRYRLEKTLFKVNFFLSCLSIRPFQSVEPKLIHIERVQPPPSTKFGEFEAAFLKDATADWNS